ncbi:MAG: glycosyltransferase family 2 protein [Gammaproteobacteria bacterium AqS3]|nr:glycosyltransferase family 2 protein [Gammaproteobacteria bacterium AqS3]
MHDRVYVAIAALTRRRPKLFENLLESLMHLRTPDGVRIDYIFVENDEQLSIEPVCQAFAERTGLPVHVLHEPVQGISLGRNQALEKALDLGCDFLAFVDDDEEVDADWMVELLAAQAEFDTDLTCGWVYSKIPDDAPGGMAGWMLQYRLDRYRERERQRLLPEKLVRQGEHAVVAAHPQCGTGNWLFRLDFARTHDLRFDPTFKREEDQNFYQRMKALGGTLAQARRARVWHIFSAESAGALSIYRRKRNAVQVRYGIEPDGSPVPFGLRQWLMALAMIAWKLLHGAVFMILAPLTLGRSLFSGLRAFGFAAGLWRAARGAAL